MAGLVAADERECACVGAEGLHSEGGTGFGVGVFELVGNGIVLVGHLEVDHGGFDGPNALKAPAGGGHIGDDCGLHGVNRLPGFGEAGEERVEFLLRFVFEDDLAGA